MDLACRPKLLAPGLRYYDVVGKRDFTEPGSGLIRLNSGEKEKGLISTSLSYLGRNLEMPISSVLSPRAVRLEEVSLNRSQKL